MSDLYFLDTNILMYAVGSEHPLKKPCLGILEKVVKDEITAVTDTEVFQEIAYRYWSQRKWKVALEMLKDFEPLFTEIYPVERDHLPIYYELLSEYPALSPRDAIHAAIMQANQLRKIVTTDKAFEKIPSLKVYGPT